MTDRRVEPGLLSDQRILVTGANGFLGRATAQALRREGANLRLLDGPPDSPVDIADRTAIAELAAGIETVVHLAGPASVASSWANPFDYARVHVGGTSAVLEACRSAGVRRLVYMSSAEVYGQPSTNPVAEDHPLHPLSPYGACKRAAEEMVKIVAGAEAFDAIVMRAFSIYGPGQSEQSLIATITKAVRLSQPIALEDLAPVRDYSWVGDVAEAIMLCCAWRGTGYRVFNIASGSGIGAGELAALVAEVAGKRLAVVTRPRQSRPARSMIFELIGNAQAARTDLGWSPKVDLKSGLRRLLADPPCAI